MLGGSADSRCAPTLSSVQPDVLAACGDSVGGAHDPQPAWSNTDVHFPAWPDRSLGSTVSMNFFAFDVETANGKRGSVCSIGVSVVRDGVLTTIPAMLTVPPGDLNYFTSHTTAIHGLTAVDVVGQPSFAERMAEVMALVGDLPMVAHNAPFDSSAIRAGCDAAGIPVPPIRYTCSLAMCRAANLGFENNSLSTVAAGLGISMGEHHLADADAEAAANIVLALAAREGVSSLEELAVRLGAPFKTLERGTVQVEPVRELMRPEEASQLALSQPALAQTVPVRCAPDVSEHRVWAVPEPELIVTPGLQMVEFFRWLCDGCTEGEMWAFASQRDAAVAGVAHERADHKVSVSA